LPFCWAGASAYLDQLLTRVILNEIVYTERRGGSEPRVREAVDLVIGDHPGEGEVALVFRGNWHENAKRLQPVKLRNYVCRDIQRIITGGRLQDAGVRWPCKMIAIERQNVVAAQDESLTGMRVRTDNGAQGSGDALRDPRSNRKSRQCGTAALAHRR